MAGTTARTIPLAIPTVIKPLRYRLEIGDSQTRLYTVQMRQKPAIEEIAVTFHFPAYLGRGDETAVAEAARPRSAAVHHGRDAHSLVGAAQQGTSRRAADRFAGTIEDDGRRCA